MSIDKSKSIEMECCISLLIALTFDVEDLTEFVSLAFLPLTNELNPFDRDQQQH